MAGRNGKAVVGTEKGDTKPEARSLKIGQRGIKTSSDFVQFMSGLMTDLVAGKVAPEVANAASNAGGKMLKVVEMQYKYTQPKAKSAEGHDVLTLSE